MLDAIQLKRAAAQLKRAVEILAVDPKDYRALSYVAARAMMDGKDEQKWGANHARRASRSAKPTLDPGAVSRSAGPCSYRLVTALVHWLNLGVATAAILSSGSSRVQRWTELQ